METVSAASTLVEVGCEGECKERKGKQRAFFDATYSNIVFDTLRC